VDPTLPSSAVVGLQEAPEGLLARHLPERADAVGRLSLTCSHAGRHAIADALKRASLAEMPAIAGRDAAQALDAEEDQVVQALLA
jgi:hypothetical protein